MSRFSFCDPTFKYVNIFSYFFAGVVPWGASWSKLKQREEMLECLYLILGIILLLSCLQSFFSVCPTIPLSSLKWRLSYLMNKHMEASGPWRIGDASNSTYNQTHIWRHHWYTTIKNISSRYENFFSWTLYEIIMIIINKFSDRSIEV